MTVETSGSKSSRIGGGGCIDVGTAFDEEADNVQVVGRRSTPQRRHAFHRLSIKVHRPDLLLKGS